MHTSQLVQISLSERVRRLDKFSEEHTQDIPWFETYLKRFFLLEPILIFYVNSIINVFILARDIATEVKYYDSVGPKIFDTPSTQHYGTYTDMSSTLYNCEQNPSSFCSSMNFAECSDNSVDWISRTCQIHQDSQVLIMILAFTAWAVLYMLYLQIEVWTLEVTDLRFYLHFEYLKNFLFVRVMNAIGAFITLGGVYIGVAANLDEEGPSSPDDTVTDAELERRMGVYLQLVMFCFINLYSLSSMLGSPLHGLKEATKEIEAPIPVLPLQNSERDYKNCWGCRISCKEVIENIELALLRSLVHDDPAYIERYGYKDQLESIVYKFHLCQKSEMVLESDVEDGEKVRGEASTSSLTSTNFMRMLLLRSISLFAAGTIFLNSYNSVIALSAAAQTTTYTGYERYVFMVQLTAQDGK